MILGGQSKYTKHELWSNPTLANMSAQRFASR